MKKQVSFLLVMALIFSFVLPTMAADTSFSDVSGHWGEEYITEWTEKGVIGGYPDGTFRPDQNITRAEVCKILALAYEMPLEVETTDFSDVAASQWFYDYVQACASVGVVGGYPNGTFAPNAQITRSEAVKMVAVVAGLDLLETGCENFSDYSTVPSWAPLYWNALKGAGVIDGYPDNTIRPVRNITRAEFVKILCFAFKEEDKYPNRPTDTATITFKIANGTWADGTTADKTVAVTLYSGKGTLKAADIPTGMKANAGYSNGKWNVTPSTAANTITGDVTYTYSFSRTSTGSSGSSSSGVVTPAATYTLDVSITDTLGKTVSDSTGYLTGDSVFLETLLPMLIANRSEFKTNFPSLWAEAILDEGVSLVQAGYASNWDATSKTNWENFINANFASVESGSADISVLTDVDTTIADMAGNTYTLTTTDQDAGDASGAPDALDRTNVEYTVVIKVTKN